MRFNIISNAYKLKNIPRYHKVYLKPDLTIKERDLRKELRTDLDKMISEEPNKKWGYGTTK